MGGTLNFPQHHPKFNRVATQRVHSKSPRQEIPIYKITPFYASKTNSILQIYIAPLTVTPSGLQLRELEKQVARVEMEKDILKKAAAYFAKEHA